MELKKGAAVKITTVGTIVGYRRGDKELPESERSYQIHVAEETLYLPPSHFEVLPDAPTPERVLLAERYARLNDAAEKYASSPNPANNESLLKALAEVGLIKKR
jgi:hypothetical protein